MNVLLRQVENIHVDGGLKYVEKNMLLHWVNNSNGSISSLQ